MLSKRVHRLSVLFLVLAVALGLAGQGAWAAGMSFTAAGTAAGHASMQDGCKGCADKRDNGGMAAGICAAPCAVSPALLPTVIVAMSLRPTVFPVAAQLLPVGRAIPPDPFPPRPDHLI